GKIVQGPFGTEIRVRMRLHAAVATFMTIWFGFLFVRGRVVRAERDDAPIQATRWLWTRHHRRDGAVRPWIGERLVLDRGQEDTGSATPRSWWERPTFERAEPTTVQTVRLPISRPRLSPT